jgi:hypothetical protein
MLERIGSGQAMLAVGTHALFQQDVHFQRLGLVIIDEQHRFGVHQRLALREKGLRDGLSPHQLIMTATPIPRTLAMCAYADLDSSSIDELPPGRTPVQTVVLPDTRRHEVVLRVRNACKEGRQAYWVCTLIEESDSLQAQAAEDTLATLSEALPELRVGLVHGRLKPAEKRDVDEGVDRREEGRGQATCSDECRAERATADGWDTPRPGGLPRLASDSPNGPVSGGSKPGDDRLDAHAGSLSHLWESWTPPLDDRMARPGRVPTRSRRHRDRDHIETRCARCPGGDAAAGLTADCPG